MVKRIHVENPVSPKILGDELTFPTTKRVAKNRFLKTALSEYVAEWDPSNPAITGMANDVHVNMYEKWAAGGFGAVLHASGGGEAKELETPERCKIWAEIASKSKKHGALIIGQLSNAGRQTPLIVNSHPFSSSDVGLGEAFGRKYGKPITLTTEQVQTEVIEKFVYASKFLYENGFDGIQLHGAHGYMIAQFLSRTTNKRTDKYGGSAQNRARIVVDIYNAIRKEVPISTGFLIGIKINSVEFQNEGLTNDEAIIIAEEIDKAGLDFIELSGGTYESLSFQHRNDDNRRETTVKREAFFLEFSEKIKPAIKNAIVYVTGGFRTVPGMVQAINENATDGIGLGRPITQDFDLPLKLLNGVCKSAIVWPFGDDFNAALLACACQMAQAGATPYCSIKGVNYGIMDLTDEKTLEEHVKAQAEFMETITKKSAEGIFRFGVVPYKLNGKTFITEGIIPKA